MMQQQTRLRLNAGATIVWWCLGFFLWSSGVALAGSMTAEIDKTQSSMDEPFWLTVAIRGSLDGEVVIPETTEFEILRTGESTNISIINGSMTKERQYTFQVRALKEGRLMIPALKAKVDDKELATEPIAVDVKGGTAPTPNSGGAGSSEALVLAERELPKTSLYEGEVMISKVRLLTRARLTGATPARDASPDWRLISVDGQKNTEIMRDGVRWSAIEMTEAMIPLKSGRLKSPPFGINASWIAPVTRRKMPRSVFDMFQQGMFNTGEEVSKKILSDSVNVTVKPLPSPRPADFADIVGAFKLTSQVSKRELGVGETATVTIELKGQGALDRAKDLKLAVAGAKIYADKPSLTETVEPGAGLISKRVVKFAVVPTTGGTVDLGGIKLSVFNPFTESFEHLTAELGQLQVAQGAGGGVGVSVQSQPKQPAKGLGNLSVNGAGDAQTDHNQESRLAATPSPELTPRSVTSESVRQRPWYLTTVGLAIEILLLAVMVAIMVMRRVWGRVAKPVTTALDPKLSKVTASLQAIERDGPSAFHQGIEALRVTLAKAGQDPHALTSGEMVRAAEAAGFDVEFVSQLRQVLTELDQMIYGGQDRYVPGPQTMELLAEILRTCRARSL